jgi:hypothetical protein
VKLVTAAFIAYTMFGSLVLGGCTSSTTNKNTEEKRATIETGKDNKEPTQEIVKKETKEAQSHEDVENHSHGAGENHSHDSNEGQVLKLEGYQLKFIAERDADESHLHLYVAKGNNQESVADAIVQAQVQAADGKEKTLDFKYDEKEKGYVAVINNLADGKHQIKFLVNVQSKKLNGRFQLD